MVPQFRGGSTPRELENPTSPETLGTGVMCSSLSTDQSLSTSVNCQPLCILSSGRALAPTAPHSVWPGWGSMLCTSRAAARTDLQQVLGLLRGLHHGRVQLRGVQAHGQEGGEIGEQVLVLSVR